MGTTESTEEFEFACPECGESISVNESMREALLEHGCVVCGAAVSPDDFRDA